MESSERYKNLEEELKEAKELLLSVIDDCAYIKRKRIMSFLGIKEPKKPRKDIEWPTLFR